MSVAAEVGRDHALTGCGQAGDHVDVAVDVVRKAVEQERYLATGWSGFEVGDLERVGSDVAERLEPVQGLPHAVRSCIQARSSSGSSSAANAGSSNHRSPSSARDTSALVTPCAGQSVTSI